IYEAYRDGRIDSEAAAILMARQVLVDLGGTVWTVGFATGRWYRSESEGWQLTATPPEEDDLYAREELASLLENPSEDQEIPDALADFLVAGVGVLPEAVEAAWTPPETVPASAVQLYRTCPACGATVAAESRFCSICGASRPELAHTTDRPASTQETSLRCPECGAPVHPGQAFCMRCGAPQHESTRCPACGADWPPGARFCPQCGTRQDIE
ncbi:MAG: zinc ribbon domain-containing protein, partial [Anaerolineae bacterium]